MNLHFSPELDKELKKLRRRDKTLLTKIEKKLILFQQNPQHPSLRLHKLTGSLKDMWSISIDKSIRMLYFLDGDEAHFFDIGTHRAGLPLLTLLASPLSQFAVIRPNPGIIC